MMNQIAVLVRVAVGCALLAAGGCAYPIAEQYRRAAREDLTFAQVAASPQNYRGQTVIWGGVVLDVDNFEQGTLVTILQYPLDWFGQPKVYNDPGGRFIARVDRFLDPLVYGKGREVTLAGEVAGGRRMTVGGARYLFPEVAVRQIHLWKPDPWLDYEYDLYPYDPFYRYGPYYHFGPPYHPYGPFFRYGPYYRGFFHGIPDYYYFRRYRAYPHLEDDFDYQFERFEGGGE